MTQPAFTDGFPLPDESAELERARLAVLGWERVAVPAGPPLWLSPRGELVTDREARAYLRRREAEGGRIPWSDSESGTRAAGGTA